MSRNVRLPVVLALLAAGPAVLADESSVRLAQGEGVEQVQAACAICHSLDYIVMNSPFQDRAAWEKTVTKMVKVMGAPITAEDTAQIVGYLDRHYGKGAQPAP
jgi:cytochrome c5